MKHLSFLLLAFIILANTACKTSTVADSGAKKQPGTVLKTTANGLNYQLFPAPVAEGAQPRKAQIGEIVSLHMSYDNGADSVLFTSYSQPSPLLFPVMEPTFKGGLEEGFAMLSPGDSAVFYVNADSLFAKTFRQPMPDFVKEGSLMKFRVKMINILSQEEAQAEQERQIMQQREEMASRAALQAQKDDQILQEYIKTNNLKAERTESGLYYIVTKKGTGENAKAGQTVKVHYTGTTLDGKKFDSSVDRGQPFEFQLGQGQVIQGWDVGIALLNKGAKATLLIPSTMAYGERSPTPAIPSNGILKFDVELIDMK